MVEYSSKASKFSAQNGILFDRIKNILEADRFVPDPQYPERLLPPFHSKGFAAVNEGKHYERFSIKEETACAITFCSKLYDEVGEPNLHITRLDRRFSELLVCHFHPTGSESPFRHHKPSEIIGDIAQTTLRLLNRVPAVPLDLPGLPRGLASSYFAPPTASKGSNIDSWEYLKVASHLSINVIRVAICITIYPWIAVGKLSEFIDDIAMLMEHTTQRFSDAKNLSERHRWYLVRAFLWSSWQRSTMIYFALFLARHLESGVEDENARRYFLRNFSPIPGTSVQEMSKRYASLGKARYMCSWAFELLRNDPVCIGMDFRRMHRLYSHQFDGYSGRCNQNSGLPCKGDQPRSCNRFVGMVIEDQSAHDGGCMGCKSLIWDENSYRSITGARAVSLETSADRLRYRKASRRTLAISHVWSHGQGGRPETGMNACLHQRYRLIATSMGCDSYWMDTPCIPTDHVLRREAIMNINKIFAESKATLVCDRDLMEIDTSGEDSVQLRETILITTITCDWNIRAWTFLEAFRARQSIHLLCKNNKTVSLRESVEIVHRNGSLDIAILLLTIPHLLPRVQYSEGESIATPEKYPEIWARKQMYKPLYNGFLTVENSGKFLSHRPASRPGDDIVIWSLLLKETVYESAIDFWRSRQGDIISTGFLVSTAPRVNIWRLGWAPSSPNIFSNPSIESKTRSMGFNDTSSEVGRITPDGLKADWLFYKVRKFKRLASKLSLGQGVLPFSNIRSIWKRYLQDYRWGALLRPMEANAVLDPLPALNREDGSKVLIVVCGTNDYPSNDVAWEWKGVHEWDFREALPTFARKDDILLV